MSPSRGTLYRLLHTSAGTRPQCSKPRLSSHRIISSTLSLHRTSHALSLSLSSISQQTTDAIRTSNDELHPKGLDSTLFESTTSEYEVATSHHFEDSWNTGPTQLLLNLLGKSIKDATTTLQELKKLDTILEARLEYALAAKQCSLAGDFKGCLGWLNIIPNFYSIPADSIRERDEACMHIASVLNIIINGSAETYIVCLALLKIVGKGYIGSDKGMHRAMKSSLAWLIRHGKVADQKEDQEWTWQLWTSLVREAHKSIKIISPTTSKVTLDDTLADGELSRSLSGLYNGSVRALALSGRYEAAMLWVQNSDSFQTSSCDTGTRLDPFTWRLFLEEVLDCDSPASAKVRGQAGALATTLQDMDVAGSDRPELRRMSREILVLTLDKNADEISLNGTLEDRVNELLEKGDVRGGIAILYQALTDAMPAPRWGHLPKAANLAKIREAVSKIDGPWQQEELKRYIDELHNTKGGKGLAQFSHMIQLSQDYKMEECVSFCISTFQSRDIEQLALLIDETVFQKVIDNTRESQKLRYSKYASYLALKNLAFMCKDDFFKMQTLYRAWLQSALQHVSNSEVPTSSSSASFPATNANVFEESSLEYFLADSADLPEQHEGVSPPLFYQVPPTAKPSIYHFNLFLKMLPRALALSTRRGSSSMKAKLDPNNLHARLSDIAFNIIKEVEKFKLVPNASTWSILISLLARNINAIPPKLQQVVEEQKEVDEELAYDMEQALEPEEYKMQWDRIWKLSRALGMGLNEIADKKDTSRSSTLQKATALTYAELIRAFLLVPPSRGGPCLEEAERVKSWLQADREALSYLDSKTEERINAILGILAKEQATTEERADFWLKKRGGHVTELAERLRLP